jgi:tRNA dimethylallyltransferase
VPHHLVDLVEPDVEFTAGDYAAAALAQLARGPGLLVGGTGFYLRAAAWSMSGTDPGAQEPAPEAFNAGWEARERESPGTVHAALQRVDPPTAAAIHPRNVVRALRALWLCEAGGRPISEVRAADPPRPRLRVGLVVLEPPWPQLDRAIDDRCAGMLRAGLVDEVEMLRRRGYDARHKSMRSLGYRQILDHLAGRTRLDEAQAAIQLGTRQYARRQLTYVRHQLPRPLATLRAPLWPTDVDLAHATAAVWPAIAGFVRGDDDDDGGA